MSTSSEEPTFHELVTRLAGLEQAHARLHEELTKVRAERAPAAEKQASSQTRTRPCRSSRRKMLTKGLGVAVASVGAGTLLELSGGTAFAKPKPGPGVFASNVAGTPAVGASGTSGADGVDASSDSGTGLLAKSSSGLAGHFVGNVQLDNNLTVAGGLSTGTLSSGAGSFASSVSGTPSVKASGTSGADGMDASSDSGTGVSTTSGSGTGLLATSSSGDGVHGMSSGSGVGVFAQSSSGIGMHAVGGGTSPGMPPFGITEMAVFAEGGLNPGVLATSSFNDAVLAVSSSGFGVLGTSGNIGVVGTSPNGNAGVFGNSGGDGVLGESTNGNGVHGRITGSGLAGLFDGNVQVNGNFTASGTKSFVQAHPTDPGREIVYVALEGGEAGTYVRGTGQLRSGKAVLALPEHFGLVTTTEGLTIQLTPREQWLQLYVVELDTAQIIVREAQGKSGLFDYFICGVRKGYEQHEVLRTKG